MNLVNVIHPYVFKIVKGKYVHGPIEAYQERDQNVAAFLKQALDSGASVIHQRDKSPRTKEGLIRDVAFALDPAYDVLFDPRIKVAVTHPQGRPFDDERPEAIPEDRWNYYMQIFTTRSALGDLIGQPDNTFFIGGAFEACLANAAGHQDAFYRQPGQKLLYIPELCVCFDEEKGEEVMRKLAELDINAISYKEAMELLGD